MKHAFIFAAVAALFAGCASRPEASAAAPAAVPAAAPAKAECKPPPKQLVTRDLVEGSGKTVGFRTAANVFYSGWLYDGCAPDLKGKPFDSNTGQSIPFPLMVGTGKVIKGWDEGLVGMKEKGKRLLVIPPDKGYGDRDLGKIPPNSTLVFEVEVVQIVYQP